MTPYPGTEPCHPISPASNSEASCFIFPGWAATLRQPGGLPDRSLWSSAAIPPVLSQSEPDPGYLFSDVEAGVSPNATRIWRGIFGTFCERMPGSHVAGGMFAGDG